jgi:hypothetical protein
MEVKDDDPNLNLNAPPSAVLRLPRFETDPNDPEAPPLERAVSLLEAPWTTERSLYRALTIGSVALNPLFAIFLYQSILQVRDLTLEEFGAEDAGWASTLFT